MDEINSGYKKLIVWQKSIDLVEEVYAVTKLFPNSEIYGLTSQMRRCSISIPSNIAEGYRRKSQNEFYRFLSISFGSSAELETQIEISKRLNFVKDDNYYKIEVMLSEIMKMLNKMLNSKKAQLDA